LKGYIPEVNVVAWTRSMPISLEKIDVLITSVSVNEIPYCIPGFSRVLSYIDKETCSNLQIMKLNKLFHACDQDSVLTQLIIKPEENE
jgi:hypothetical protein